MMRRLLLHGTLAAALSATSVARASLTPSETEQVRRAVATATDLPRVRALVARPDLTADETAAALAGPIGVTPLDAAHAGYLRELVFGDPSEASRPVLAVAVVRGILSRADALLAQHPLDLERSPAALSELALAYDLVGRVAAAGPSANVPASARAQCARVLGDHLTKNPALLPQSKAEQKVRAARTQAAIALLDFTPEGPTRRIDAAERLGLTGVRRDVLIRRGVLVLDGGGDEEKVRIVSLLTDRLPALKDGVEAIVAGGGAVSFNARNGAVLAIPDDPAPASAPPSGPTLLWGGDVRSAPSDAWATTVARTLADAAISRAAAKSDDLRARIQREGGLPAVSALTAMLILNGPLAVDLAASRLRDGRKEYAAALADAIAALNLYALPSPDGPAFPIGPAKVGAPTAQMTHITLDPGGLVTSFAVDGARWRIERSPVGTITALHR